MTPFTIYTANTTGAQQNTVYPNEVTVDNLSALVDELKTLLEITLIQSTGASNRIEGIFTSDKRLEEQIGRAHV